LLPHHVPSLAVVRDGLLHKDVSGTLFIQALVIIGWLAWASFAVSVMIEVFARLRGRSTITLPGLRAQQRWAASLIAAITLMFASPALASASAAPHAAPPAVVSTAVPSVIRTVIAVPPTGPPGAPSAASSGATAMDTSTPHSLTYHVKRGDYLGAIAQRYEGKFGDYQSLAKANHITDASHIEPGWTLALPSDAHDRGVAPHASGHVTGAPQPPAPGPQTSGPQTPAPAGNGPSASTGTSPGAGTPATAPSTAPSSTAPSSTAPSNAAPASTAPSTTAPSSTAQSSTGPSSAAPSIAAPKTTAPASAPTTNAGNGGATPAHSAKGGAAANNTQPSPLVNVPRTATKASPVIVETLEAAGTLAAIVTLSLVAVSRREQLQRRLVKHVPATPTGGAMPRLMAPTQQRDLIRVDASLRSLAAMVDGWPIERIPQIAGVWTDHGAITLMLADDCGSAPRPFLDDPNGWMLAPSGEFIAHPDQVAPLPTLVTVGGRANQHLLLDVEYLRLLGIGGDAGEAMNLLRFIAVELCHNVWSDDVRVVLTGFGDDAGALAALDPDRVRVQPSIAEAATRFRHRLARAVANWDAPPGPPEILLVARPPIEACADLTALETDLMRAPGVGMAVVVGGTPDGFEASRYQVRVNADGLLRVGFLGDAIMPAASLPTMLLPEVSTLIESARRAGDTSPLDLARAASRAAMRVASEASESTGRRSATSRTGTMAGAHRRPPGEKPAQRESLVDLTKARHVRTA
jgi:hypothetical protein